MDTSGTSEMEGPPLAPLLRLAWQQARRQIYEDLRHEGYRDLHLADLVVFQYPTPEGTRPLMTKQAVNRIIRHLEQRGYLRVEPAASDRRARIVRLTTRGKRLLATIKELHEKVEADWAGQIGERNLGMLRMGLTDLIATFGQESCQGNGTH
jgi:MarR family